MDPEHNTHSHVAHLKEILTTRYLDLALQAGNYRSIPEDVRTIFVDGEPVLLQPGVEVPWFDYAYGACVVRVYDLRMDHAGRIMIGIGNETLPILAYVPKNMLYDEWPD